MSDTARRLGMRIAESLEHDFPTLKLIPCDWDLDRAATKIAMMMPQTIVEAEKEYEQIAKDFADDPDPGPPTADELRKRIVFLRDFGRKIAARRLDVIEELERLETQATNPAHPAAHGGTHA